MNQALGTGMTRLVLIRHGEPEESAAGRCYGRLDFELSPRGLVRASEIAVVLDGPHIAGIYSSPSRRTLATARPLAERRGLSVDVRDALREIDFGVLEGLTYDEAAQLHSDLYATWMAHPTSVRFPGGESYVVLRDRVISLLEELVREHRGAAIAVVSHAGVIRTILGQALRLAGADIFRLDISCGSISIVDYAENFALVRLMNGFALSPL